MINGSGSTNASISRNAKSICTTSPTDKTVPDADFRRNGTRTRHPGTTPIPTGIP